jgi:hypothetical protein
MTQNAESKPNTSKMNTLRKLWRGEGSPSLKLLALSLLILTLPVLAQEKGEWRAANQTARTITGDVLLSDERISINFARFTISRARALEPSEISAAFDADTTVAGGSGNLYRLNIPGSQKFLNRNTLCGSEPVLWMATYAQGRSLKLAFFSSEKLPVFTLEALANSSDLCGTFVYAK